MLARGSRGLAHLPARRGRPVLPRRVFLGRGSSTLSLRSAQPRAPPPPACGTPSNRPHDRATVCPPPPPPGSHLRGRTSGGGEGHSIPTLRASGIFHRQGNRAPQEIKSLVSLLWVFAKGALRTTAAKVSQAAACTWRGPAHCGRRGTWARPRPAPGPRPHWSVESVRQRLLQSPASGAGPGGTAGQT